jgi:hypothetical protein
MLLEWTSTLQDSASRANVGQVPRSKEVEETEGFARKSEDAREADFRLANRPIQREAPRDSPELGVNLQRLAEPV